MSLYGMKIEELSGIGKKRAELFKKLGVFSVGELLNFYPRTYEDWSEITDIADVEDGAAVCIRASVHSAFQSGFTKTGKYIAKTIVTDETGACELIYFNNKYIDRMLINGNTYRFFGKASNTFGNVSMIAPTFSPDSASTEVRPVYNLTSGLNNNTVVNAVKQAINLMPEKINDPLPEKLREKFSLCDLKYAIKNIHFPENMKALETAQKRLVVEELLVLNLGLRSLKSHKRRENMNTLNKDYSDEFESLLPFKLTNAQKNAIKDCINDIKNPEITLNRLVQGDVGSGKTVVAGSVCYSMIKNGFQTAFMAPTEILAEQLSLIHI